MPFYTVADNTDTVFASDVDQYYDAFNARNDVGTISTFAPLASPGAPTVAVNTTAGNLTGAYQYAVAFLTGYWKGAIGTGTLETQGNTGGGTASATVSPSAQQVNLTAIPTGPVGTVARIIYRTKAGGSTFYQLTQINDNTTTSYTDNIADTSLSVQMPTTNTTGTGLNIANGKFTVDTTGNGAFAGSVTASTPVTTDNSTKLATTAFVKAQNYITSVGAPVQSVAGKTGAVVLAVADISGAAPSSSPSFTGTSNFAGPIGKVNNVSTVGNFGVSTVVALQLELGLTTTNATTVLSYTPTTFGLFAVHVYIRYGAASNLTLTVTWYNGAGVQQANTIVNNSSIAQDSSMVPVDIGAGTGGAITITATASVASNLAVSSWIEAV